MSFLKKIFGRNFEESVAHGVDLLESGRPGEALLELEQALAKGKNAPEEQIAQVRQRIAEAKTLIAQKHLEDGRVFIEREEYERATECLETAMEVCDDEEIHRVAQRMLDDLESDDARAAVDEEEEMTEEERFQILSGRWEDERADELESYGNAFTKAFLDFHDGKNEAAVEAMEELLEKNPDALFLHLEIAIGKARLEKYDESIKHIRTFLAGLDEEDELIEDQHENEDEEPDRFAPQARVEAHAALSSIYRNIENWENAEKELRILIELLPEESSAYVLLGEFLREQKRYEESLEILTIGQRYMGDLRPNMDVIRELGLTHRAMGNRDQAIESLKAVLEFRAALNDFNYQPGAAEPLAELYEEKGELERACDIYRHLAKGTNVHRHYQYNLAAGRLLLKLSDSELARRHLSRARELALDDKEKASVAELFEQLED